MDPRLLVHWPVSWCLFHTLDTVLERKDLLEELIWTQYTSSCYYYGGGHGKSQELFRVRPTPQHIYIYIYIKSYCKSPPRTVMLIHVPRQSSMVEGGMEQLMSWLFVLI